MIVYKLAKEKNLTSKDLIGVCKELGFVVKAQNKLNEDQLAAVLAKLEGEPLSQPEEPAVEQAEQMEAAVEETPVAEPVKKEAVLVAESISKNLVYVVSECAPFTRLGVLGTKTVEFIESTKKDGHTPTIFLPLYGSISDAFKKSMEWVMDIPVTIGGTIHRASVLKLVQDRVVYYFISNDAFFGDRDGIYGYSDDVARFTFFNRAILTFLPLSGQRFDEVHLNDWHTSIFSLLLRVEYSSHDYYAAVKTVLNIHDLEHQGWCEAQSLTDVLGISHEYYENGLTRMGNGVNLLKSGIETADQIQLSSLSQAQMQHESHIQSGMVFILETKIAG